MGKVKFGLDADDAINAEAGEGGTFYEGPVPPKGTYAGILKRLELIDENKNGDPMLKYLIELKARPGSDAEQYDGYGVWGNQNVTDQGKGYVNQFLDALTDGSEDQIIATRRAFWGGQLIVEDDGKGHVLRIGKMKIDSPDCSRKVAFQGKRTKYQGDEKLEVAKFLVSKTKEEPVDISKLEELPDELNEDAPAQDVEDPWEDTSEPESDDTDSEPLF